jgi:hypothetical protein
VRGVRSLEGDGGSGALEGSFGLLRGVLGNLLQDRLRSGVNEVLGLLQAEAREGTHLLDDLDLLLASSLEDDVEVVLLLDLLSSSRDPDEKRNGFLRLGGEAASELIVNPEFHPGFEITDMEVAANGSTKSSIGFAKDRGPQTLHGRLTPDDPGESVPVFFLQAHSTNGTGPTQTLRPIWSLIGGHIEPLDPFRLQGDQKGCLRLVGL